jgi:uncharacterized protein YcfL
VLGTLLCLIIFSILFVLFLRCRAKQRQKKKKKAALLMEHHAACQNETLVEKSLSLSDLELDYSSIELVKIRAASGG